MTFTISFGYWLIPLGITLLSYFIAWFSIQGLGTYNGPAVGYGFAALFDGMAILIAFGLATLASLVTWLIYFITLYMVAA